MLKIYYKNPLTRTYQYEYALYSLLAERFAGVECRSRSLSTLLLYYAELVKENEGGRPSYTRQFDMEDEVAGWLARDFDGRVTFPCMKDCCVELAVFRQENGTHKFFFSDGIYGFSVRLRLSRNGRPNGILVEDGWAV